MKCKQCGLVNFKADDACRRCGTSLIDSPKSSEILTSGVWKDLNFLVLEKNTDLPRRCMKCNSSNNVTDKTIGIGYYPKYNLALLIFGVFYYKTYSVGISMCQQHISNRGNKIIVYTLMMVVGAVSFIFGYSSYLTFFLIGGVALFAIGSILLTIGGTPFAIEKVEDSKIWLKGVNENYLASLPLLKNR
jgi:Double zinc ribbon